MPSKYNNYRSDQEWLDLITECRQSGLTDKDWCETNSIPVSSFYNAISRLRKKACEVPEREGSVPVMDLTSHKQDVVPISIVPDPDTVTAVPAGTVPVHPDRIPVHSDLDNLHTIEIFFKNGSSLRVSNDADAALLQKVICAVGGSVC